MEPNVPLLRKVVEWAEYQEQLTEGREWLQAYWIADVSLMDALDIEKEKFCGTAMCIAGKVALDAGYKPHPTMAGEVVYDTVIKDGELFDVEEVAAKLLFDEPYDHHDLFEGSNTAADIRRIAEAITGEPL